MTTTIPDDASCSPLNLDDIRALLTELSHDCPALVDLIEIDDTGTLQVVDTIYAMAHALQGGAA